jgi:hypothetical protein
VEALESRKLPDYVTRPDTTELEQMLSLATTDNKVLKMLKRECFNLASCLVGCYVSEQGPQKSNNRYDAAYAYFIQLVSSDYRGFRFNSFGFFEFLGNKPLPAVITDALREFLTAQPKLTKRDQKALSAKKRAGAEEEQAAAQIWKKGKEIMDAFNDCKALNSKYGALYTPLKSGENKSD